METILFTCIENSIGNKGGGGGYYLGGPRINLEKEAIDLYKSWRKYGGKYKDCKIVAICCNNNPPSVETIEILKSLNVTYIEIDLPISKGFPAGWWNVPLCGKWLENQYIDKDPVKIVHLDLDMILLRNIKESDLHINPYCKAVCAVYSEDFPDDEQMDPNFRKEFVTCFIISKSNNMFYTIWFDKMMEIWSTWESNKHTWWAYCNIEEHAVDVLYHKDRLHIDKIYKIQIGPGYDSVESLSNEEFNNVLILHGHPEDTERNKVFSKYVNRKIGIN